MICTYFRSSSLNTYDLCPHKYFLEYVICKKSKANKKAEKGTITHKTLEWLAQWKLCQQNGVTSFIDDIFGEIESKDCEHIEDIVSRIYDWHVDHTDYDWNEQDFLDCIKWVKKTISLSDGLFDPRTKTIISPEFRFDVEIKEPWSHYHYELPNGEILDGNLSLKGTVDLVIEVSQNPKIYEIWDYKTGKRLSWSDSKEKDLEYLQEKDTQLLLYYYALSNCFSDVDDLIFSMIFINDGGGFTIGFDKSYLDKAEAFFKKRFTQIIMDVKPKLENSWRCKFCSFYKDHFKNNKTTCQFFRDEIIKNGMNKVVNEYANFSMIGEYGEGGGRK